MCGLVHSTCVTAPVNSTGLLASNSAANEWCADMEGAARVTRNAPMTTCVVCMGTLLHPHRRGRKKIAYPEIPMPLSITWLGHATFLLRSPGGRKILFDPWVTGNPASP